MCPKLQRYYCCYHYLLHRGKANKATLPSWGMTVRLCFRQAAFFHPLPHFKNMLLLPYVSVSKWMKSMLNEMFTLSLLRFRYKLFLLFFVRLVFFFSQSPQLLCFCFGGGCYWNVWHWLLSPSSRMHLVMSQVYHKFTTPALAANLQSGHFFVLDLYGAVFRVFSRSLDYFAASS